LDYLLGPPVGSLPMDVSKNIEEVETPINTSENVQETPMERSEYVEEEMESTEEETESMEVLDNEKKIQSSAISTCTMHFMGHFVAKMLTIHLILIRVNAGILVLLLVTKRRGKMMM
jgi:hypothetical protein